MKPGHLQGPCSLIPEIATGGRASVLGDEVMLGFEQAVILPRTARDNM